MASALGFMFRVEAQVQQGIVVRAGDHDHVASAASVAARRASVRDKLLATERKTAVAAVAGLHEDSYFI